MSVTYFNGSRNNTTDAGQDDEGIFIYYYGLFSIITFINLPGNTLVIITFLKHESLREPCNYFIVSLAVNDLLTGIMYPIYNAAHIKNESIQSVLGNFSVCKFLIAEINALWCSSSYHLVAITVTRFLCIVKPLRYRDFITNARSLIAITSLWTVIQTITACMLGSYEKPGILGDSRKTANLAMLFPNVNYNNDCRFEVIYSTAYNHVVFVIYFFIPLTIMFGLYARIICIARKQAKVMALQEMSVVQPGSSQESNVARNWKAVIMVAFLLFCYCVGWIPLTTYFYIQKSCGGCITTPYVRATARILLYLNSATNVFVYAGRFAPFRDAVKKDFKCLCQRCTRN